MRWDGRCLAAVAIGAGWDIWNLFYTSIVRLESPLYARLALQSIHDRTSLAAAWYWKWLAHWRG